jgi:hypothetical protein
MCNDLIPVYTKCGHRGATRIGVRHCSAFRSIKRMEEQARASGTQPSLVLIVPLRQQCENNSGEEDQALWKLCDACIKKKNEPKRKEHNEKYGTREYKDKVNLNRREARNRAKGKGKP